MTTIQHDIPIPAATGATHSVHRAPWPARASAWAGTVLLAAALLGCLFAPFLFPFHFDALYLAYAGALVAAYSLRLALDHARLLRGHAVTGEEWLAWRDGKGRVTALRWDDVTAARLHPLLQRLDVRSASGTEIRLPFALDGYDGIAAHVAVLLRPQVAAHAASGEAETFRATRADSLTIAVAPAVLVLSLVLYGTVLILAWLVAAGATAYWLFGWLRIRVADDALIFRRPIGEKRVPFTDIAAVALAAADTRNALQRALLIAHTDGRISAITGVREGEHALHDALVAALGGAGTWPDAGPDDESDEEPDGDVEEA